MEAAISRIPKHLLTIMLSEKNVVPSYIKMVRKLPLLVE